MIKASFIWCIIFCFSASFNLKDSIKIKFDFDYKNISSVKISDTFVLHNYNESEFLFVSKSGALINRVKYDQNTLDLPVPVKRGVRIVDFFLSADQVLYVAETNTKTMYTLNEKGVLTSVKQLENSPFSISTNGPFVFMTMNDFEHEYLIVMDTNFEELYKVAIGASLFKSGVRSSDPRETANKIFFDQDHVYVQNNESELWSCPLSSPSDCKMTSSIPGHVYKGKISDVFISVKDDWVYSSKGASKKDSILLGDKRNHVFCSTDGMYILRKSEINIYHYEE